MAAWNIVLGDFQEAHDPEQQHKDGEAVFWVAEAKRGSNGRKGRKPLQADRCRSDGPKLDRRKGKDRNGQDQQPSDPAEEALGCHVGGLADCAGIVHGSFELLMPRIRAA